MTIIENMENTRVFKKSHLTSLAGYNSFKQFSLFPTIINRNILFCVNLEFYYVSKHYHHFIYII